MTDRQVNLAQAATNLSFDQNQNAVFQEEFTIGRPVSRPDVPEDLAGKYMGDGTNVMSGRHLFNTKVPAVLTPTIVNNLNALLSDTLSNWGNRTDPEYYGGLYGSVNGGPPQPYVGGATQYYPDAKAKITLLDDDLANSDIANAIPTLALPGSTESIAANDLGFSVGLVYVKNPESRNGYLRPGTDKYREILINAAKESLNGKNINRQAYAHLFAQGLLYGLGPVHQGRGIQVTATPLYNFGGSPYVFDTTPPFEQIVTNPAWSSLVKNHYDTYLKSGDGKRVGKDGSISLFLRNVDKLANPDGTPLGPAQKEALAARLLNKLRTTGSAAGIAKWAPQYSMNRDRLGLTAFPMRVGRNAVPQSVSNNPRAGECNYYGSGPQITQSARPGEKMNLRTRKLPRKHPRKHKASGPTTYYCGPTGPFTPDRSIYQAGQAASPGPSMADFVDSLDEVQPGVSNSNFMRYQSVDRALNPEKYGLKVDPYFISPVNKGFGIHPYAAKQWANLMTPAQRENFNKANLNSLWETNFADATWAKMPAGKVSIAKK